MIDLKHGDCLELMKDIKDKSIDMVLCDLPYGTTSCSWDNCICSELLFREYRRILTDTGVIALFGSEPFSTTLKHPNLDIYKYDFVWKKIIQQGCITLKICL